jgi:hypothetical protein
MSSSAITTQVAQLKAGNIQNQADSSSIYSSGQWSFKNSTAVASVTITDAGNVGIGTASPTSKLHVNAGGNYGILTMQAVNGSDIAFTSGASTISSIAVDSTAGANPVMIFRNGGTNTERMRINASGSLLVDPTYSHNTTPGIVSARGFGMRAGTVGSSSNVFNINWTGSVAQLWIDNTNNGTISLTSDYRIKQNIETQELPALERIAQLRPVKYELADYKELFKADGVQREGFIAHELQAVIPSAVEGEKDAEDQIQSLKLDALCSVMVKAIQEQQAQIEEMKAKLAALEAKP